MFPSSNFKAAIFKTQDEVQTQINAPQYVIRSNSCNVYYYTEPSLHTSFMVTQASEARTHTCRVRYRVRRHTQITVSMQGSISRAQLLLD